jgi:hypothetical protein
MLSATMTINATNEEIIDAYFELLKIELAPARRSKKTNGLGFVTGHGFSHAAKSTLLLGRALALAQMPARKPRCIRLYTLVKFS